MIRASRPDVPQQIDDDWGGESGLDLGHIARLLFWGVLAISSLAGAFLAARTDLGSGRIAAAWNAFLAPPHKPTAVASATQPAQAPRPSPAASAPAPVQGAATVRQPPAPPVTPPVAPAVSPEEVQALGARVQALAAERDRLVARIEAVEQSLDVTGSVGKAGQGGDQAAVSAWSVVPIPTGRPGYIPLANMPPFTPEPVTEWAVSKTEFGIDLGAAPTLEGIRSQWAAVRAQHAALMDGLRPAVAIREVGRSGHELRLIVGPFTNAAYAARICVVLSKSGRECRATTFEGQRLAAR